ncbi:protein ALTERED SEED GERMINATION 2 isoform X1 [Syzygium oleosum]|uniref:protein ALTERED SEED GERMINATION 2 isoform X1 n=2 Tax=Syzygium oleosum TaxID=219896 RepID=UPI0011D2AA81|nr:protein ALTERED SEED GERMINATION 2 isoform X1 [Syzygium oleosum]XP_030455169.1 protein ALTERED SEED GERMINATION 2 isoform X1 [Syzygium oleosum]XP_056167501.1 protein ALTERED SEED GERMINATION 2 isoform X1 [Syzygium oleosum]XP_056167502.1 protein ALTERED SEED GERMINATION 2 isoform X1 [Syzygium oleosum]XP_056167503.1 protein ALTERED SEED GERMINATION 2 isoform X1 [Syzygium oleosum]
MADCGGFRDGNVRDLVESRCIDRRHDANRSLQMHSSLVQRLSHEKALEGHQGCVNAIAWNSSGSLLISGSDDTRINIWSYSGRKLLHSIDTGHSANIFCTKFVPETSDELVVSGAGDAEVRLFNLSRLDGKGTEENAILPSALFQCHTRRVKKLAVEVGNPNVVWSASEDGTLRQHDFREGNSCPPAGSPQQECRSVLLDLRSGSKKSLTDPPKGVLALKSCDISSTRPHLILVGGSDAFGRLYDRRMLPPLTSCRKKMAPPPCVNYFCPMHLSDRGRSSLHLTHVTFSPNGEEVLLSYSGEHVYLMNVNPVGGNAMKYTAADVSKLTTFTPWPNGVEMRPTVSKNYPPHLAASQLEKFRSLMQFAEASLREGTNYYHGIEACNEVLDGHGQVIEPALRIECLCTRAALLLKRKWKNDVHMAIRDCQSARMIDTSSVRPLYYMSEALCQLGKHKEALNSALSAQCLSPSDPKLEERVQDINRCLAAAEAEKNNKVTNGAPRYEPRGARVLSLSDILFRSEANSDASQDGPRSEREESDYDEEMEVDFETSISGDEGRDVESNVLHGSLNLRIHRRGDSSRETASTNDSCGSPSSSSQNDKIPYQPEAVIDMTQRYVGHCNVGTDIKQASFLGQRGEYVASGSDDGRWFIWEKTTGRLIKMLLGDEAVVNCVQCHPFDCVVATSGIDNTIKIWTPNAPAPSIVAGVAAGPETANVLDAMENNERRLMNNREIILPFEILERFRMHESAECAQS